MRWGCRRRTDARDGVEGVVGDGVQHCRRPVKRKARHLAVGVVAEPERRARGQHSARQLPRRVVAVADRERDAARGLAFARDAALRVIAPGERVTRVARVARVARAGEPAVLVGAGVVRVRNSLVGDAALGERRRIHAVRGVIAEKGDAGGGIGDLLQAIELAVIDLREATRGVVRVLDETAASVRHPPEQPGGSVAEERLRRQSRRRLTKR